MGWPFSKVKSITTGLLWKVPFVLLIIASISALTMLKKKRLLKTIAVQRSHKQASCRRIDPNETIFVSIASYRDPECHATVFDCLEKAACPLRVFIGVCQQNYPVDVDVLDGYRRLAKKQGTGDYRDQIRVVSMDAGQAQGPMYARSIIEQNLYRGERYYLIIDSHMLFTPDWDTRIIETLKKCPSVRSVLTMYPDDFHTRPNISWSKLKLKPPSYLRFKQFNSKTGLPEVEGPLCKHRPSKPLPNLFWAACFSFARAEMMREVPYDPYCPYVFMGEEISMAARLFTHGWDLYTPTDMIVRHMWTRRRPTYWEQFTGDNKVHSKRQSLEHKGYRRLRHLFKLQALQEGDTPLGQYGLGSLRSLTDYQNYCGIDFLLEKATSNALSGVSVDPSMEEVMTKLGTLLN
jgi:hypothetical protein